MGEKKLLKPRKVEPLSTFQVAEEYPWSRQRLALWRHQHRGPAYCKIGRLVVYLRTDLEQFLLDNRIVPGGE